MKRIVEGFTSSRRLPGLHFAIRYPFAFLFLILIHIFIFTHPAYASGLAGAFAAGIPKIDAVLVLDASNSMRTSDPGKLSAEAMMMFIDMLSIEGDKVGIVSYTGQIEREKALTSINDAADKEVLKDFVGQLQYGSWTDITVGLDEAVQMLDDARDQAHKPVIVLLTDGNNELDPNSSKTPDDADADTQRIIDGASAKDYPVYTIGLNYDGGINQEYLQSIAGGTGGLFFETSTADDLPDILTSIFADQMGLKVIPNGELTADGEYQTVDVEIPDPNILEANITFLSGEPLEDVELYDPSGNLVPLDRSPTNGSPAAGGRAVYTSSNVYALLKILSPEQGTWRLRVKGVDGDNIKISLLYNYDVGIEFSLDAQSGIVAGESVRGTVTILENGIPTASENLYADSTCVFTRTDTATGTSEEFPGVSQNGGMFAADIVLPEATEYQISARVEHPNFFREETGFMVEPIAAATSSPVSTPSPTPSPTPTPTPQPTPQPTPAAPEPVLEQEPENPNLLLYIGIGVLGVLLLAVIFIFIRRSVKSRARVFTGRLVIEVTDNYTREKQPPQYRNLIEYGRRVTLANLLHGGVSPALSQVIITPSPEAPSHMPQIIVKCNSPQIKCRKDFMEQDLQKGVPMSLKSEMILSLEAENKQIKLRYTE